MMQEMLAAGSGGGGGGSTMYVVHYLNGVVTVYCNGEVVAQDTGDGNRHNYEDDNITWTSLSATETITAKKDCKYIALQTETSVSAGNNVITNANVFGYCDFSILFE